MKSKFKEGDLISAWPKGIYEFIRQERTLVYCRKVFAENGQPIKSKKIVCCNVCFCRAAGEYIGRVLMDMDLKKEKLLKILDVLRGKEKQNLSLTD